MSVVLFFMASAVSLCQTEPHELQLSWLVRFIHRVWHLALSSHGNKNQSAASVMLPRRSRERLKGSGYHCWIGFLKSSLMIYWCYPVTDFLNRRNAIAVCHLDSFQKNSGVSFSIGCRDLWFFLTAGKLLKYRLEFKLGENVLDSVRFVKHIGLFLFLLSIYLSIYRHVFPPVWITILQLCINTH